MTLFYRTLLLALAGVLAAVPVLAQTTGTTTTLAAAVVAAGQAAELTSATQINVTSATGIVVGDLVAVLRGQRVAEFMRVRSISGTYLTVSRGIDSRVVAHLNGATIYVDPEANYYRGADPSGACTRASEQYLPHINRTTGNISECSTANVWYRLDQQFDVHCNMVLSTDMVDRSCFTVPAATFYVVTAIRESHTGDEDAGTLTLLVTRQEATDTPSGGDALMTALDMTVQTDETVRTATLTTTVARLLLDAGDRLGLDFTDDVAGELIGVNVTITLAPY